MSTIEDNERRGIRPGDGVGLGPAPENPRPTARRGHRLALVGLLVAAASALLVIWLAVPVPIPDTYTGTGASSSAEVNDWAAAGHTFRTDRDGLYRVDVALSTLKRSGAFDVQFYVREQPKGPNLRSLRVSLAGLPQGKVLDLYSARWQDLPWVAFEFDPLYGYVGKQLYFNVEGKDIPRENTVQVLFAYPNSYPRGEAYTSEKPAGAGMVFRTFTRGSLSEAMAASFPLLARGKPGLLGQEWLYQAVAAAGVVMVGLLYLAIAIPRGGKARL